MNIWVRIHGYGVYMCICVYTSMWINEIYIVLSHDWFLLIKTKGLVMG